jgi:hypothetical protein
MELCFAIFGFCQHNMTSLPALDFLPTPKCSPTENSSTQNIGQESNLFDKHITGSFVHYVLANPKGLKLTKKESDRYRRGSNDSSE